MTKYVNEWSTTAGTNIFTVPDGWPENMQSSQINDTARETLAVIARWEKDTNGSLLTTGTQPAYAVTLNQTSLAAYYDGMQIAVDFHATNASATAPTITVNAIGAADIYWPNGTALTTNEITLGMKALLVHDGTNFQIISYTGNAAANSVTGASLALTSQAIGDIMYYNGTDWAVIAAGTDGYHLRAKGAAIPVWEAATTVVQAVQADIEAETNEDTYIPPDLLKFHPGIAKAWAFVDRSAGTPSLSAPDYGVASVTDDGDSNTIVTFSTAFSTAVYSVIVTAISTSTRSAYAHTLATGSVDVTTMNAAGALNDTTDFTIACFGDFA